MRVETDTGTGVQTRGRGLLGWPTLATMVVGSVVGAGVFSLPGTFGAATGVYGALIAWAIAGTGTFFLALVFRSLAERRPDLDAGVYAYAKAGFGDYAGAISAFGYWVSACLGNVTYWVLITQTVRGLWPGQTWLTPVLVVVASVGMWGFYWLIGRGVQEAAIVNRIVTIAKVAPIVAFVIVAVTVFDVGVFADNLWGGERATGSALLDQVSTTMMLTVFLFLGIEGANVYSRYARTRKDIGTATVVGYLGVLALFASVTMLSYGVLPRAELAGLDEPSMAGVLRAAIGPWGGWLVSIALIVAVLGAYLAWSMMAAEVMFTAARSGDMPRFLRTTNPRDVPIAAVLMSTAFTQIVYWITFAAEDAFTFALSLTSATTLIAYLFASGYAVRLGVTGQTYTAPGARWRGLAIGAVATCYIVFLLWAADPKYLLLAAIAFLPATAIYVAVRRERGQRWLTRGEQLVFAVLAVAALAAVAGLATGGITL